MSFEEQLYIARDSSFQEGFKEGYEEGLQISREKGRRQVKNLMRALKSAGRYDELDVTLKDEAFFEALLNEFHIG